MKRGKRDMTSAMSHLPGRRATESPRRSPGMELMLRQWARAPLQAYSVWSMKGGQDAQFVAGARKSRSPAANVGGRCRITRRDRPQSNHVIAGLAGDPVRRGLSTYHETPRPVLIHPLSRVMKLL